MKTFYYVIVFFFAMDFITTAYATSFLDCQEQNIVFKAIWEKGLGKTLYEWFSLVVIWGLFIVAFMKFYDMFENRKRERWFIVTFISFYSIVIVNNLSVIFVSLWL